MEFLVKQDNIYFIVDTKFIENRDMTLYFINPQNEEDLEKYPTTMLGYICGSDINEETLTFFAKRTIIETKILQAANALSDFHQKDRNA